MADAIWVPNFWLPTPATAARSLGYGYFMADVDLGKMFLNFPLHESLKKFSGVDFSHYATKLKQHLPGDTYRKWVHWVRCWMGFKPSPYMAVRFYYWAEEFARGNRRHKSNALRWDHIVLNLPGDPSYDPTQPRVMKGDADIKNIAGDIVAYVDDLRASGHSIEQTWAIVRQIVSRFAVLWHPRCAPQETTPSQGGRSLGRVNIHYDGKGCEAVGRSEQVGQSKVSNLGAVTNAGGVRGRPVGLQEAGADSRLLVPQFVDSRNGHPLPQGSSPNVGFAPSGPRRIWLENGQQRMGSLSIRVSREWETHS
jgi:hypothetical protein